MLTMRHKDLMSDLLSLWQRMNERVLCMYVYTCIHLVTNGNNRTLFVAGGAGASVPAPWPGQWVLVLLVAVAAPAPDEPPLSPTPIMMLAADSRNWLLLFMDPRPPPPDPGPPDPPDHRELLPAPPPGPRSFPFAQLPLTPPLLPRSPFHWSRPPTEHQSLR